MTKLTLEDWANLSQVIASLVVVASLAYVATEIQQNTKAVQAASYQALIANLTEVDLAVVTNPELDRVITKGERYPEKLTPEEWSTFYRYALARTGQLELAFMSHIDGTLNELHWSGIEVFIPTVLCLPGYLKFWNENYKATFSSAFIRYASERVLPKCGAVG